MKKKNLLSTSEPIKVLRRLQQLGFTSAILAGGAVRDDYTGEMINDYDLFLHDPKFSNEHPSILNQYPKGDVIPYQNHFYRAFQKILGVDDLTQLKSNDPDNRYAESMDDSVASAITSIWEGLTDYNLYQIIWTKVDPVIHVEDNFDIGFCKAYCDGRKIRYTEHFMNDYKNKTFTIVGKNMTQEQFNYTMEYHVEKLKWKYPYFQVEVAPYNQHLMDAFKNG